jgi:hypothetical protein
MAGTLQRIFQQSFSAFAREHRLLPHWHRAANKISRCRTTALGGHVQACAAGHVERVWYNSCRHRSCPQCNRVQMDHWLQKQTARLIDCCHHHIIFTIPHDLNPLWMRNTPAMMELLFHCAQRSLQELLHDERRLGDAEPGFLLALHTWGRSLSLHPHLHCLITDGGLSSHGWQRPKGSCFLPARVLMAKFRGKLLAMLQSALARGELVLPDAISLQQMQTCCNRLGRTKWNVHLRERYGHGNGVMRYLARYVRGGPMHSDQVTLLGRDRITLRYTPHTDSGTACRSSVMMLSPDGFLRRYLQHVPEPRKHTVRSYGLYAPRKSNALNRARATFRQAPVAPTPVLTWQAYYVKYAAQPVAHACPVCGGVVGNVRRIAPHHDPPRHCAPLKSTHA